MAKKKRVTKTSKRGRPKGATNKIVKVVDIERTACPGCASTDRVAYYAVRRADINSRLPDGRVFNGVTWRRTRCKSCGQHRIDREYHFVNS
jgi:hypothetical protein